MTESITTPTASVQMASNDHQHVMARVRKQMQSKFRTVSAATSFEIFRQFAHPFPHGIVCTSLGQTVESAPRPSTALRLSLQREEVCLLRRQTESPARSLGSSKSSGACYHGDGTLGPLLILQAECSNATLASSQRPVLRHGVNTQPFSWCCD
jgi:hypothetical protein